MPFLALMAYLAGCLLRELKAYAALVAIVLIMPFVAAWTLWRD